MKKKMLFLLIILIIGSILAYNYIYQEHRDIKTETIAITIKPSDLVNVFQENNGSKYLNQTLLVVGDISEINNTDITLDDAVFCDFNSEVNIKTLKSKSNVSIKGRCIGYDELLEQVKLDQCIIILD